jgi:hypothetical protein
VREREREREIEREREGERDRENTPGSFETFLLISDSVLQRTE